MTASTRNLATPSLGTPFAESLAPGADFQTACLHAALPEGDGNPLVTPLVQSTTFCRDGVGSTATHQYSRCSNPTVAALELALGALERAEPATCFATGLAAETALFLALLTGGDHVVCGRSVYGGTTRILQQLFPGLGITTTFVDATDTRGVIDAIRPNTKLVFLESPANPTLELTDIRTIAQAAHNAGDGGVLVAVDNTFLTPVLQQPLELGADISVYSTTKFIEGHSAALGGALVTRDAAIAERFAFIRKCTGAIQSPLGAWLTLQGLKTLPIRLHRQSSTAGKLAQWLEAQPQVAAVHYPGLESFGQRALADSQHLCIDGTKLHGAVVTIELAGGAQRGLEAAKTLLGSLKLCRFVEHVGSVETLVTHPATMTHADVPPEQRRAAGVLDGLLRISVGLEDPAALLHDWATGLAAIDAVEQSRGAGHVRTTPGASATKEAACLA